MKLNELGKKGSKWVRAYRPKKHRTTDAFFAHMHCEVSEAWREWREGRIEMTFNKAGKPHGLGAELADVVIMAAIVAHENKIDLDHAVDEKFAELLRRLDSKQAEKAFEKEVARA